MQHESCLPGIKIPVNPRGQVKWLIEFSRRNSALNTRAEQKQQYAQNKLVKRLHRQVGQAIGDFNMIEDGDRIMVCLSGGKDSFTMLDILLELQRRAPVHFDLIAVNLDQKQPGFPEHVLPEYLAELGVAFHVIEQDTYSVVKRIIPEGKTTCGLCSRMRRGALYQFASENGITRIALGHHRDDIIETLFLNLFNGGRIKAMPPKLLSDDGQHVVIRPLAYCSEEDIERYAASRDFPIIPCNLCGSQPNLQRQAIKEMLSGWKKKHPGRVENIFRAIGNVSPSQLADHELFDFRSLGNSRDEVTSSLEWLMPKSAEPRAVSEKSHWAQ
jgi:tRNA 2-thiocytidine biosynthesis protein TtcA